MTKSELISLQKSEDYRIEQLIKMESQRWFDEYINAPIVKIADVEFRNCGILILSPFIKSITIYDEETAKYGKCDIYELVKMEFNKLKLIYCE